MCAFCYKSRVGMKCYCWCPVLRCILFSVIVHIISCFSSFRFFSCKTYRCGFLCLLVPRGRINFILVLHNRLHSCTRKFSVQILSKKVLFVSFIEGITDYQNWIIIPRICAFSPDLLSLVTTSSHIFLYSLQVINYVIRSLILSPAQAVRNCSGP